jgi:hypothetical protein
VCVAHEHGNVPLDIDDTHSALKGLADGLQCQQHCDSNEGHFADKNGGLAQVVVRRPWGTADGFLLLDQPLDSASHVHFPTDHEDGSSGGAV